MTTNATLAKQIFERTALSRDDVLAERTVDLVIYQFQQSAVFFRIQMDEGGIPAEVIDEIRELVDISERLAEQLAKDHLAEIDMPGAKMPAYLAAAYHLDCLAAVVRAMILNPEWKEYYDDIARKLNEYANGLRIDPESSFRAI